MKLNRISVRAKLAALMLLAMILLAGTRGVGLMQLGGYLERMNGYTTALDEAHQHIESAHSARIKEVMAGRNDAASQQAHEAKVAGLRRAVQAKRSEADAAQQRERSIMYATYVSMLVLVFVVCGSMYWLLMKTVVRPLQGMAAVADRVAAGDLSTDIAVKGEDEIGKVMQALRDMNGSLARLIGKIRGVSQSLGDSNAQIAGTSDSLTRHLAAQTEFLHKTATTLRDLADAVATNAESAGRARELAANAREVAIKGGEEVHQAVNTMSSISASSKKIVDIVSIIDGITFQTNILALNAAVEAARAGEQGRGFAVVAAEVRSLAQRSATAAKQIAGLINSSVHELQQGSGLVEKAGATMVKIVNGARAVDDIMREMAAASARQRAVIDQVRVTVDRVDQTDEQQALLAHAAEATASMRKQTQELIAAVSVFRLRGAGASRDDAAREPPIATVPLARLPDRRS